MARLSSLSAALLALAACQPVPPETPPLPPIAGPGAVVAPAAGADGGAGPVRGGTRDATPTIAGPAPAAGAVVPVPAAAPVGPPEQGPVALAGRPFFCARLQPLPAPPPYCTRSIGQVDCWSRPPLTVPPRPGLADGRMTLTPSQAAQRTQCWPGLL